MKGQFQRSRRLSRQLCGSVLKTVWVILLQVRESFAGMGACSSKDCAAAASGSRFHGSLLSGKKKKVSNLQKSMVAWKMLSGDRCESSGRRPFFKSPAGPPTHFRSSAFTRHDANALRHHLTHLGDGIISWCVAHLPNSNESLEC